MDKLSATRNLLALYEHYVGISEVPMQYHQWACLSLIAACVRDRVYLRLYGTGKTVPNLYVFLLGPSGVGKEKAISTAASFVRDLPAVNLYAGRATAPKILDKLGKPLVVGGKRVLPNPKLYLVTEELAFSVRSGDIAYDLLTMMTQLYVPRDYPVEEGTRMHGNVIVRDGVINWLAGSTAEWLIRSVPKDAIEGGFFGRVLPIIGEKDYSARCPRMQFPSDRSEVRDHLQQRITALTTVSSEIGMTAAADEYQDQWYMNRLVPEDDALKPFWNRGDETIHKLAILLLLAEWDSTVETDTFPAEIEVHHLKEAIALWEKVYSSLPSVLRLAASSIQSSHVDTVEALIAKYGTITHSDLLRRVSNRGLDADAMRRAIGTLLEKETVKRDHPKGSKGWVYEWQG